MKTLIVEDDLTSRTLLQALLRELGPSSFAVNGREAVTAVKQALDEREPFALICLDIMMPEMDGQEALRQIRALEAKQGIFPGRGAKVVMTSALRDKDNVMEAFRRECDGYLVKPIQKEALRVYLREFGLITSEPALPNS